MSKLALRWVDPGRPKNKNYTVLRLMFPTCRKLPLATITVVGSSFL